MVTLVDKLLQLIPDPQRVTANETILEQHSRGMTPHPPRLPDAVVFPKDKEEVSKVMAFAYEHEIPVVPFGVGSSIEGHVIPLRGGISLDMTLMNRIIEVRPDDFIARVQPGITRTQLNAHLKHHGLFFAVDPGADASIGGMAATNASGTNAVRYGIMRDQVLGLEVVLADGRIIRTGGLSFKSSAGYDLTGLFVGSEGTLGIFTEITLRLHGIPETITAAKAVFPNLEAAAKAVEGVLKCGIPVGRMELVDELTIRAVNSYSKTDYTPAPTLFLEFSGNRAAVDYDVELTREMMEGEGCLSFEFEKDVSGRNRLWEARHSAAIAIINMKPGSSLVATDVCVPISELTRAILFTRKVIDDIGMEAAILGHVGDGNFHAVFGVDPNDQAQMEKIRKINEAIIDYALSKGGTCTGEHGIGSGKKEYLLKEHGESVELMKAIKRTLDPKGILNPGKIFD